MIFFTPCFLRLFFNEYTKSSTGINACDLFILWNSLGFQLSMKEASEFQKYKVLFTHDVKALTIVTVHCISGDGDFDGHVEVTCEHTFKANQGRKTSTFNRKIFFELEIVHSVHRDRW